MEHIICHTDNTAFATFHIKLLKCVYIVLVATDVFLHFDGVKGISSLDKQVNLIAVVIL